MMTDTIAAIATPIGEGGLAVIRVSGQEALQIADRCFKPIGKNAVAPSKATSHTIHFGHIARNGENVDEVLLSVMRAPRTFTREDVVEITCHGGLLPAKLVLDTLLHHGARAAEPGEFTRRAFLNGRIDLAQAEAVTDLIHSRTELALRAANEQLAGKLSSRINELRDDMLKILAHVEAHIDFPDEDIAPDTKEQLLARLEKGRPNVGKSSLLNQLLGHDRAIVSPTPGTTRDTIEETANIRGLPLVFIDTAGLRETADEVEQEGVRRSRRSLEQAELILHVLDSSEPLAEADRIYLTEFAGKKRILVLNKSDLPRSRRPLAAFHGDDEADGMIISVEDRLLTSAVTISISCVTGAGMEALKDAIKGLVWSGEIKAEMLQVMINSRHQDALSRARTAALRTIEALRANHSLDLVALDLRIGVNAVGEIVGKTTTEDLLDTIFSQFCIGK